MQISHTDKCFQLRKNLHFVLSKESYGVICLLIYIIRNTLQGIENKLRSYTELVILAQIEDTLQCSIVVSSTLSQYIRASLNRTTLFIIIVATVENVGIEIRREIISAFQQPLGTYSISIVLVVHIVSIHVEWSVRLIPIIVSFCIETQSIVGVEGKSFGNLIGMITCRGNLIRFNQFAFLLFIRRELPAIRRFILIRGVASYFVLLYIHIDAFGGTPFAPYFCVALH